MAYGTGPAEVLYMDRMNLVAVTGYALKALALDLYHSEIILGMAARAAYCTVAAVEDLFITALNHGVPYMACPADLRVVFFLQFGHIEEIIMAVPALIAPIRCTKSLFMASKAWGRLMPVPDILGRPWSQ